MKYFFIIEIVLWKFLLYDVVSTENGLEFWNMERPVDMASIKSLEVMCGKTFMEVQISFDRPFNGIIFSKGAVDQYNCIYVKPQTGASSYSFNIMYDKCGTKPDMNGKFYENNIVIQYDKDLIEVWDEAKRLRCEWYNDYEKGITKPPIRVSDIEVVELNFRGDNVDCWMEIQHGKGPWANLVSGIVPLGTTLTMVIGIKDVQGEFDMRVKSCLAEAENSHPIHLSDEHGCVLRPKMISRFMKISSVDNRASVITYAFFHAFKFPDSMAVNIKCKVEICRFGCPEHCQRPEKYKSREKDVSVSLEIPNNQLGPRYEAQKNIRSINKDLFVHESIGSKKLIKSHSPFLHRSANLKNLSNKKLMKRLFDLKNATDTVQTEFFGLKLPKISDISTMFTIYNKKSNSPEEELKNTFVPFHRTGTKDQPLVYTSLLNPEIEITKNKEFPHGPRNLKLKRNKRSSEEMGVISGYKVISEVDLAFKPSFEKGIGVLVFQGKMIPEEVIFGVCIPASGFSVLFVLLSLISIIAVIITGFLCYHKLIKNQIKKEAPCTLNLKTNPYNTVAITKE